MGSFKLTHKGWLIVMLVLIAFTGLELLVMAESSLQLISWTMRTVALAIFSYTGYMRMTTSFAG